MCVLRPEPTFSAVPVWTLSEGEGGLLTAAGLAMDRAPAYNRVIATGENTSLRRHPAGRVDGHGPVVAHVLRRRVLRTSRGSSASAFITSDAQAASAAASIGTAQKGVARSLALAAVPQPALEPGDLVLVKRDADRRERGPYPLPTSRTDSPRTPR